LLDAGDNTNPLTTLSNQFDDGAQTTHDGPLIAHMFGESPNHRINESPNHRITSTTKSTQQIELPGW
jgi:hypothetical protein